MTAEEWAALEADPRVIISQSASYLDAEPASSD